MSESKKKDPAVESAEEENAAKEIGDWITLYQERKALNIKLRRVAQRMRALERKPWVAATKGAIRGAKKKATPATEGESATKKLKKLETARQRLSRKVEKEHRIAQERQAAADRRALRDTQSTYPDAPMGE